VFEGGFESLALHQNIKEQGNRNYLKLEKNEHLVRFHIGLEDPSDLIADIKQSLKYLK
jgi:cystathionine beta-lyase